MAKDSSKELYKKFAERLLELMRKRNHISTRNPFGVNMNLLAKGLGVSPPVARRYLMAESLPHPTVLVKMAAFLKTSVEYLLYGDEGSVGLHEERAKLDEQDLGLIERVTKQLASTYMASGQADIFARTLRGLLGEILARRPSQAEGYVSPSANGEIVESLAELEYEEEAAAS